MESAIVAMRRNIWTIDFGEGDLVKKMMIITYHMLPFCDAFGACQRMYYLASEAASRDYEVKVVHVLTGRKNDEEHRLRFNVVPIELRNRFLKREFGSKTEIELQDSNTEISKTGVLMRQSLKAMLGFANRFFFNEPVLGIGIAAYLWSIQVKEKILSEIRSSGIAVVIISGPPFSLFRLARTIKKTYPNVKVILDYRDPWNLWNGRKGIAWVKEKREISFADKIVFASKNLCDYFRNQNLISVEKSAVIPNGYSETLWSEVEENRSKICKANERLPLTISHVGSLQLGSTGGFRDTSVFMDVISCNRGMNLSIKFVGASGSLKKYDRRIEAIPRVSQSRSLHYMLESDVLIVMHTAEDNSGRFINTGKFFDYIRSGKIIWGIGRTDTFFNQMIREYSLGITSENNYEAISSSIRLLYDKYLAGELSSLRSNDQQSRLDYYSREKLNRDYVSIIDDLIRNG